MTQFLSTKRDIKSFRRRYWFLISVMSLCLNINHNRVYGFIPNIYEPNAEHLRMTGNRMASIASKFIQYGPTKEGTNLAKLAVTLYPKKVELWMILAEGQIKINKLDDAMVSINKAKIYNPELPELWFAEASISLRQNKPQKAIKAIQLGLKFDPKNAIAYFQLGNAKLILNKKSEALKDFVKSSKLKPDYWQSKNNQGLVLYELGKKEQAISIWRNVLKITNDAEPKLALAAALNEKKSKIEESIELAKEALNSNPNYVSQKHQKEQLWGVKLQAATKELFKNPKLETAINKAMANSNYENN